jgi:hypothetical protein
MTARPGRITAAIFATWIIAAAALPALGEEAGPGDGDGGLERKPARISIGVSLDYAWWEPVWRRISQAGDMLAYYLLNRTRPFFKFEPASRAYEVGPALLYGLHCDAELTGRWGLSAGAIVGAYRDASVMVTSLTTNPAAPSEFIKYRMDAVTYDTAVQVLFRCADWLRISFGPVYQGYALKERNSSFLSSASLKEIIHMAGAGAGGSFSLHLVENLYFRPVLSLVACYGTVSGQPAYLHRDHSIAVGGTVTAPLAYYLEKIRVTLTFGFRYQVLYYVKVANSDYVHRWDHRYGLTESITYTF